MIPRHLLLAALACRGLAADPPQVQPGGTGGAADQPVPSAYEEVGGRIDPQVTNGRLYIKAMVDITGIDTLMVDDTVKIKAWDRHDAMIAGCRYLSFAGHPGKRMHFRELKPEGLAFKINDDEMIIKDYMTWEGREGGAGISAVMMVPREMRVIVKSFRIKSAGGAVDLNDELNGNWNRLSADRYGKIVFETDAMQVFKTLTAH